MYLLTKRKPKLTHQGQDLRFEFVPHAVRYNPVDVLFSYASFLAYERLIIVDYNQFHFRSVRRAGRERKPREKMTARVLAARCTRASRPKDFCSRVIYGLATGNPNTLSAVKINQYCYLPVFLFLFKRDLNGSVE